MPPNYRQDVPLARNERKALFVLGAGIVLVGAALGAWQITGASGGAKLNGRCADMVVASSTGGAIIRHCGNDARSWCAAETRSAGAFASQAQAACRRSRL
jgi:hypothetical protein